ncbi:hypothetical protein Tco_0580781 [Tanacetum coccineum]
MSEKYPSISKRHDEEYHTIKDDTLLCSMYTTKEVTLRAMQILDELLIDEIKQTHAYKDYVAVYGGVEVPTIQLKQVESTKGTITTPNPELAKKKKKGKQIAGESSTPKPSLKIRIKRKSTLAAPIPPIDDAKRDDLIEATQLSLAKSKTAKEYESQQNVSLVDDIILKENVEKLVKGDKESDGDDFVDTMILSDEDPDTRLHDDAKTNEDKDDDDDHINHALNKTRRMGSSEVRTKKMQTPIPSPPSSIRTRLSLDKAIAKELMNEQTTRYHDATNEEDICANNYFKNIIEKVDESLEEILPKLATSATNELVQQNLLCLVVDAVKKERERSKVAVPALISQELMHMHQKSLKNFSKFTYKTPLDAFLKRDHDNHLDDDALPRGEKSLKRQKTSRGSKSTRGSSSK